jgi:hypothetical protein
MKYIRRYKSLNEDVKENFLEDFVSTFTDLVDDGYEVEFRNPYGTNSVFQDYLQKNQTWQKFSSSFSSARLKQLGIFIHTLNKDYDSFCKLVDDMRPVILSLDDLGWDFIRFNSSIFDVEFVGVLYTFKNNEESNKDVVFDQKNLEKYLYDKSIKIVSYEHVEDEDDDEYVEIRIESIAFDGRLPDNINEILYYMANDFGFEYHSVVGINGMLSRTVRFYL